MLKVLWVAVVGVDGGAPSEVTVERRVTSVLSLL